MCPRYLDISFPFISCEWRLHSSCHTGQTPGSYPGFFLLFDPCIHPITRSSPSLGPPPCIFSLSPSPISIALLLVWATIMCHLDCHENLLTGPPTHLHSCGSFCAQPELMHLHVSIHTHGAWNSSVASVALTAWTLCNSCHCSVHYVPAPMVSSSNDSEFLLPHIYYSFSMKSSLPYF